MTLLYNQNFQKLMTQYYYEMKFKTTNRHFSNYTTFTISIIHFPLPGQLFITKYYFTKQNAFQFLQTQRLYHLHTQRNTQDTEISQAQTCVLEYSFLYEFFRILFSMLQQFLWKLCASEENYLLYIFSFLVLFFKSLHVSSCLILMEQKATWNHTF